MPSDQKSTQIVIFTIKTMQDFPGGPVVKNPSCNVGNEHSIPSQGTKISHVKQSS